MLVPQIKDEIEDLIQLVSQQAVIFLVPQIKDEMEDLIQLVSQQAVTFLVPQIKDEIEEVIRPLPPEHIQEHIHGHIVDDRIGS